MDDFLGLKCDHKRPVQKMISEFNDLYNRISRMELNVEDLALVVLLRALPRDMDHLVATIRYMKNEPALEEVLRLIQEEILHLQRREKDESSYHAKPKATRGLVCEIPSCRKKGHTEEGCWMKHPDKAPICRPCGLKGHIKRAYRKETGRENALVASTSAQQSDSTPWTHGMAF